DRAGDGHWCHVGNGASRDYRGGSSQVKRLLCFSNPPRRRAGSKLAHASDCHDLSEAKVRVRLLEVTRLMSALVAAVAVAACGKDDNGTQPTTTQTYTLAVANGTETATQGGKRQKTANISRTGGFAGPVALTATGLPTGVTAAFDPQSAT